MADETKPITSADLGSKPERTVSVGANPFTETGAENKRDTSGDQSTKVRALKSFHKFGDMKGEIAQPGDEFEVPRHRAAQLRANGLIEYTDEGTDAAIHGEVDAKRIDEKVKHQAEVSKIPENSRGTPLRNPELKMAEAPADNSGKRK